MFGAFAVYGGSVCVFASLALKYNVVKLTFNVPAPPNCIIQSDSILQSNLHAVEVLPSRRCDPIPIDNVRLVLISATTWAIRPSRTSCLTPGAIEGQLLRCINLLICLIHTGEKTLKRAVYVKPNLTVAQRRLKGRDVNWPCLEDSCDYIRGLGVNALLTS